MWRNYYLLFNSLSPFKLIIIAWFYHVCFLQVGVVSDEKLLELLELAMASDTAETVKRARELMDSGVDPIFLMSQLASLITDVIAGTYRDASSKYRHLLFGGRNCEHFLQNLSPSLSLSFWFHV